MGEGVRGADSGGVVPGNARHVAIAVVGHPALRLDIVRGGGRTRVVHGIREALKAVIRVGVGVPFYSIIKGKVPRGKTGRLII